MLFIVRQRPDYESKTIRRVCRLWIIPFDSHKILKLAEKMKWEEAIIDGSSKVQNYLLNAIMVIEKKNSLRIGFNFYEFMTFSA